MEKPRRYNLRSRRDQVESSSGSKPAQKREESPEKMECDEEMPSDDVDSSDEFSSVDSDIGASDNDADIAIGNEPCSIREKSTEPEEYNYQILSTEQIVQLMTDTIREINTVVEIPATTTRILLNHFRWDKDKLMEKFFDDDQDKLFSEAHVINPFSKDSQNSISRLASDGTEECGICFSDLPSSELTGLQCNHRFCTSCWVEYLTTKIMEEGECQTIACAAHACDILVDDNSVMNLLEDSKVKSKYQHLITNSFVECNRLLRWCPSPNCDNAIKVQYVEMKPVTCKCNRTFCFQCGENWHEPIECRFLRKWNKKCAENSDKANWVNINTKECPKCGVSIEKNGGCNWMQCRAVNCRVSFCWLCLALHIPHSFEGHTCNLFSRNEEAVLDALKRFLFYWNRYSNHMKSLKFESKLLAKIEAKMEDMQKQSMSWIEVQYLKKGVDVLCACRQTLMYTYVFAFYLKKNNQSTIFEVNQADLENATECLSEYLERDASDENLEDSKRKVQDKYRYCEGRSKMLLKHVQEGYEKDLWEFMD